MQSELSEPLIAWTRAAKVVLMASPQLRIYYDSEDQHGPGVPLPGKPTHDQVTVPLGDVLPLLADAVQTGHAWLRDFEEEHITVSADLYEVLLAYQQLRSTG
jgi:hypothetical protein